MCNHAYTADYKQMPRTLGKRCSYPEFFEKARLEAISPGILALPVDDHGECIFHSREVAWKRDRDFEGHFLQLVGLLLTETEALYYDFAEFVFVGAGSGPHTLNIADTAFLKHAYFTAASFVDSLTLEGVDFRKGANFRHAMFLGDLRVKNSRFGGLDFRDAKFERVVYFLNVAILSFALFGNARFTGTVNGGYVVKFEDSCFDAISDFSGASFVPGGESAVVFLNTRFEDTTDFTSTRFACQAIFSDVTFTGLVEFVDTSFDTIRSSVRYRGFAVEFKRIVVAASAVLNFESSDPNRKLFNHDVHMSFKETPAGLIRFENVNFNNIISTSRQLLSELARLGRVEIGSGCIKYRLQTSIKTINITEGNTSLILELCQTFASYFTVSNGLSLGFEVVERDKEKLSFFYFTDEDISEAIFRERLMVTEQHLWSLLSIRSEDQILSLEQAAMLTQPVRKQSTVINAVDGISAMFGTFFRVGIRIAFGSWKEADTRALLDAIRFNDGDEAVQAQGLHRILVDRYTGATLLGINLQQNAGLPKMISGSQNDPAIPAIDFAILTAIEVERRAVCEAFGLTEEHRVRKDSRVYWRGRLPLRSGQYYELVVAQAPDAANIDAAILTNDLLHHWKPGAALLVGIAASTDPEKVKLGDVALGSEVYYYERVKVAPDGTKPEPKLILADATLWSNVMAVPDWDGQVHVARPDATESLPRVHAGVIASGEKVIADVGTREKIAAGDRKIIAIEMEGYGFSRAVWQSFELVRHLDIRAICDDGSENKNDVWHAYAAAVAAGFAKHFLLDGPLVPRTIVHPNC